MRKRVLTILLAAATAALLAACGNSSNATESKETVSETTATTAEQTETEASHEHTYTEAVTTAPTCEADGVKTFTCECGDSYTEPIKATGHVFESYTSNNDATYTADGTETAKCANCDATDTRTAEGSMLTFTYTDMEATKYAKSTVNVRSLPDTDGEKLGGLSLNNEVKVTGQCNETGWYRIDYNGSVAYVSDSYLVDNKVEVQAEAPAATGESAAQASSDSSAIVLKNGKSYVNTTVSSYDEAVAAFKAAGIEPWVVYEENGAPWCYAIINHSSNTDSGNHDADFNAHIGGHYYWGNRLGTKDGRVYAGNGNGTLFSIQDCYGDIH